MRYTARTAAIHDPAPDTVLRTVNDAMLGFGANGAERFCTLLVAHMQPDGDEVTASVASAGHPRAIAVHDNRQVEEIGARGLVVGVSRNVHYTVEQSTLRSGDAFVAYTDGVTEVRRPPRLISAEEIGGVVARAGSRSAQCILQRLDQGLLALGRRDDDAAAIVVTIGSNSDGC